jgi:hypothetical protein
MTIGRLIPARAMSRTRIPRILTALAARSSVDRFIQGLLLKLARSRRGT